MIIGIMDHARVLAHTIRRVFRTPVSNALNVLVIGIALSLPAGIYVVLKNLERVAGQASSAPQLSLFISMSVSKEAIAHIEKQLKQHTAIERVEFVPRHEAFAQLKLTSGLADVMGSLKENPLPDAFIIHPKLTHPERLEALRDELRTLPHVDHVQLDSAWAHKLGALIKFANLVIWLVSVLLSLALVAIIFNTIRLQVLTQRDEIEISKLLGATRAFIQRPFLYFGLLQGLLGGITAWLIITVSMALLNSYLANLTHLFTSNFVLQALSANDIMTLLLFSAYLGWLGAWLSVNLYVWRAEIK
ncbi:MAG: permease-like cell division protein FtsX [Candidatus Nitrotoga sp.]